MSQFRQCPRQHQQHVRSYGLQCIDPTWRVVFHGDIPLIDKYTVNSMNGSSDSGDINIGLLAQLDMHICQMLDVD